MIGREVRRRAWVVAAVSASLGWLVAIGLAGVGGGIGFAVFMLVGVIASVVIAAAVSRAASLPVSAGGLALACWLLEWPFVMAVLLAFTTGK